MLAYDRDATFFPARSPLSPTPDWIGEGDQESAGYGSSVNTAGDVNNDGYDDLIAGAVLFDITETSEGAAFLYFGSPEGPSQSHDWMILGGEFAAHAGSSVASAGDVNNDGYDDVLVGAKGLGAGGGAWIFLGW
jgi:hypothetical protein